MLKKLIFPFITLSIALIFFLYPEVDLSFSRLFYLENGGGFYLKNNTYVYLVHKCALLICGLFTAVGLGLAIKKFLQTRSLHFKHYKKLIYVGLVFLIGPGLIVHTVVKDHVGRPRPYEIADFGGSVDYQEPFAISKSCTSDCSFPSGHASVGFAVFALGFLYPSGIKRAFLNALAIALGLAIGTARIIEGGHFLSDIVFSGMIVYLVAAILNVVIKPGYLPENNSVIK